MDANLFDQADALNQQIQATLRLTKQRQSIDILRRLVAAYDIDNMEEMEAVIEEARNLL